MKHIDNHLFNHNFPLLDQICLYLDPKKNEVTKFFFATFQAQDRSIIDSTQSTSLDDYKKQQNFFIQKHSQIFRILLKEEVSTLYKKIFKSPIPPEIKDLYNNKNIELDQVTLKIKETLASSFILLPEAVIEPLSLDTYPLSFLQEGRELLSIILRIRKAKTKEEALSEISPLENLHLSLSPEITSNLLLELCFYKFYAEQNINLCLAICTILEQWYEYIEVVRKLLQNQPILTEHRGWATGEAAEAGHLTTVQFILTGGNISEAHLGRATERATEAGHLAIIEFLFTQGNIPNMYQEWSIEKAAKAGHLAIVQCLLAHGDISDRSLRWSIGNATKARHHDIAQFLSSTLEQRIDD